MVVLYETMIVLGTVLILRFINHQDIGSVDKIYFSANNSFLNSKSWFDICSFAHFKVGMGLQRLLSFLPLPKGFLHLLFIVTVCVYEIVENNPKHLAAWGEKTYTGDALINSFTDIICAIAGYYFAGFLPIVPFIIIFVLFLSIYPCSPKMLAKVKKRLK
jgi:hypothetical protein